MGLSDIIAVDAGHNHSLALDTNGNVWVWGDNEYCQQGNGNVGGANSLIAHQVAGISHATAIAAGWAHTMVLKDDGTVWAWGYNSAGQLGDGTAVNKTVPIQIPDLTDVCAIAAGNQHSMALKNDGTVWVFGDNSFGQLGDNTVIGGRDPGAGSRPRRSFRDLCEWAQFPGAHRWRPLYLGI